MLFRLLQHVVVRRRFVFVIVRLAIILAHRIILELVPHQNAPQIRMAVEANAVEIENLALLKFRAPPDRRERRQTRALRAIGRAHANDHRPVFQRHRVEVIDRFEIAGKEFLLRFFDFLFHALDDLLHLHFLRHRAIEPIDAGHVRAVIEAQRRIVAQELRNGGRVFVVEQAATADSPGPDWERSRSCAPGTRLASERAP